MKISIITPSHNPKYLYELEDSLINQTYDNWEWILLLNNGAHYTPKNIDERIKIISSEKKMNSVGAWKKLASNYTTGDIIAEVDHDDFLTHDCLYEVAKAYEEDPEVGFVYSKTIYIKENGEFIPYDSAHGWEYEHFNWKGQQLITMNELPLYPGNLGYIVYSPNHIRTWRKDIYIEIGGHNGSLQVCDDHDLMIRLYLKTKFKYINKPLYFYRITGENTWLKHSKKIQILSNALYDKNIKKLSLRYCELKNLKNIKLDNDDINNIINLESNSVGLIEFNNFLKREYKTVQFLEEIHRILYPGGMFLCEYEFNKKENTCGEDDFYQFLYERNAHSIDPNLFWFRERKVKTVNQNNKTIIYFHVMKDDFNNQKRLVERNIKEVEWTGDKLNKNTGWNGLENYMKSIIDGFNINPKTALEFGVEYGYSTHILSQLFEKVIGVDTFEGDVHAGFKDLYNEVKKRFENTNVSIIKSDFRNFIKENNNIYDLIHIDIVHTYKDTYECADWAVQHSKIIILHDTISYPDINKVCVDLSKKYGLEYYNISKYNGLGILYNPKFEKQIKKNINIFYHCHALNHWKEVFEKTYDLIEKSNLLNEVNNIFVNFDGIDYEFFNKYKKITLIKNDEKFTTEAPTLWLLQDYCKNNDGYSLYLHGKGVTYIKNKLYDWYGYATNVNVCENVGAWVDYLLYYNVELWKKCVDCLDVGYDTVGTQYDISQNTHYSGNFWWVNNKYVRKLDRTSNDHRMYSESWLLQGDMAKSYNFMNTTIDLYINKIERRNYVIITELNKFSIIIPTLWCSNDDLFPMLETYDKCEYIDEIIIVNNNVNETPELPNSSKINVLNQNENIFVNPSWNLGVESAKNEKIMIVNDDIEIDLINLKNLLLLVLDTLKEDNNIVCVIPTEISEINNKKNKITRLDFRRFFLARHPFHLGSMFFLNKRDYTPIPDDLKIGYGDVILIQNLNPYIYTFNIKNKSNTLEKNKNEYFNKIIHNDYVFYFENIKKPINVFYLGDNEIEKISLLYNKINKKEFLFVFSNKILNYAEFDTIIHSPSNQFSFFLYLNKIDRLIIYENSLSFSDFNHLNADNIYTLSSTGKITKTFNEELGVLRSRPYNELINGLNDLITYLPNNITMAEIGVYSGESSELFLKSGKINKFYAIDPWESGYDDNDESSYQSDMILVEQAFDERIKEYDVIKIKSNIDEALDKLPKLDFVYIDGNHQYEYVKNDILKSLTKINSDGYIGGHDYYNADIINALKDTIGDPTHIFQDNSWLIKISDINKNRLKDNSNKIKNLVLGAATGFNLSDVNIFINSFKMFNNEDDIVFFVDESVDQETLTFYEKNKIKIISIDSKKMDTNPNNMRFLLSYDFLKENEYNKILLSDVRDVVFQSNPFEETNKEDFLFLAEEDDSVNIQDHYYSSLWIKNIFGEEKINDYYNKKILCVGTILGSYQNIMIFLTEMIKIMNEIKNKNEEIYSNTYIDQGINYYIGYYLKHLFSGFEIKPSGDIIATIGITLDKNPHKIKILNNVLYVNNKIPSIIHQYDRSDNLVNFFQKKYNNNSFLEKTKDVMIYDCFRFFDELDLLEIRLNHYNDIIDYFVLVEADKTWSGENKPYYYEENKEKFKDFHDKIIHIKTSPNIDGMTFEKHIPGDLTTGGDYWKLEHEQRNAGIRGLINAKPDDVIIISDLDEILKKDVICWYLSNNIQHHVTCVLYNHLYFLNMRTTKKWIDESKHKGYWGAVIIRKKDIITFQDVMHNYRYNNKNVYYNSGWHFNRLGGVDNLLYKIKSCSHSEHQTEENLNKEHLLKLINEGKNYRINADDEYELIDINEHKDEYPDYLVNNLDKYKHLIKPINTPKIYDCFTFFNELDLLEIRLNYLNDVVDYFVLVEADKTHSGELKPYYYEENKERFKDFHHKIIHIKKILNTNGLSFKKSNLNIKHDVDDKGDDFWKLENEQRNAISEGLVNANDNDIILIGDLDEIPKKESILEYINNNKQNQKTLILKNHMYFLNSPVITTNNEQININWWGTSIIRKNKIKTPQDVRNNRIILSTAKPIYDGGWHFTYLGGVDGILHKLKSFAHSEYNNDEYLNEEKILDHINKGVDFQYIGVNYKLIDINEHKKDYPDYLVNNLDKYKHLIKPINTSKVYDCFTFFNELDLLEIRLNYLNDVVDYFVLVEANKTHSGEPKPFYYEENKERFKDFHHKIIHIKKILNTDGLTFKKSDFKNRYKGGDYWNLENEQRNAIREGLINAKDDDIILIGDLDEIPKKVLISEYKNSKDETMKTFVLRNHMYYLNNAADTSTGLLHANWWGTCIFRNKNLTTPQKMRDARYHNLDLTTPIYKAGWHFTFLGGVDRVLYKTKSFAHSEYHNENYLNKKKMLEYINEGKDFIYEDIKYEFIDIKEHKKDYPDYLVDNLDKYQHLIKTKLGDYEEKLKNGFDDHLIDVYKRHIKKNSIVIDVGSYIGEHSLLFSQLGKFVYSFEPVKDSYNKMVGLFEEEGIKNIKPLNLGLSDVEEIKDYAYINDIDVDYVSATLHFDSNNDIKERKYEQQKEYKLTTIDSLNLESLDFIKIDVEGYELKVLMGGLNTIKKHKPIIVLESWDYSLEKFKFLLDLGYSVERINENKPDYLFIPNKKTKPKMVLFMGYAPSILDDKKGGSEIMAYKLCESLKNDYEIHVFGCYNNYEIKDDVYYHNINELKDFQKNNEIEILLISRYIYYFLEFEVTAKKTFIWIHDYYFAAYHNYEFLNNWGKDLILEHDHKITGYISLTQWHKEFVYSHYGIDINKIHIIGNAIDDKNWIEPNQNIKNRFIWVSRHERGLNNLLRIFPKIQEKHPDSELFIYGPYDNENEFNKNMEIINSNNNIHYGGLLTNEELIKEFQKSNFWFYPTEFAETYCISALEAQMSECIPIASDYAGLTETISDRGVLIPFNKNKGIDDEYEKIAMGSIFDLIENNNKQKKYKEMGLNWAKNQTFENRKKEWLNMFEAKNAKPILCFFMGYAPFIIKHGDGWGGSELTAKQLSEELTFWYDVYVFGSGYENIEHNGVKYRNVDFLKEFQENNEIEIMLIVRYLFYFLEYPITAKKTYLWAHDYHFLPFHMGKTLENRGQYIIDEYDNQIDGYIALTNWHKEFLSKSHNIDKNKFHVIGNAIDINKWKFGVEKVKNRFIWTSSPDRGLNHLLELFTLIEERYPDAELYIYGHEVEWYPINWNIINNSLNIHYMGKKPNDEIIKMFKSSEYWFYPTDYYDTFNISALEAQMSKTICITSNIGGIAETVGDRGVLIDYHGNELVGYSSTNGVDDDYKNRALNELFNLMDNEELKEEYKNKGYKWAKEQSWKNRCAQWYLLFNKEKSITKNNNFENIKLIKKENNKMRFHILGIFYTKTTKEFVPDPFTQQTRLICKMLTELGHDVYHYGNEGSNPICKEHISVTTNELFNEVYGHVNWKKDYFSTEDDNKLIRIFNINAINEINKRKQKNDFLLCPYGIGHKYIADNVGDNMIVVEPDIGYTGVFAPHRVFTTYSLMHHIYGREDIDVDRTPPLYDAVIPHSFDLDDYVYSKHKDDYYFFIGRNTALKGLEIAIKSVEAVGGKLIVAGQGKPPFTSKVMTHIGVVDTEQRAKWMSKAIATFVPTLYLEKFGMVVVESLLCGTPVITTDFGSFPELVPHGKVGYRCRTLKEFVIATKNIKNINPKDCREYAEVNFSTQKVSEMFQHYFTNLYGLYTGNDWYSMNTKINNINWLNKKHI